MGKFHNFSGGAIGSDLEWGKVGKDYGVESTHFRPVSESGSKGPPVSRVQHAEGLKALERMAELGFRTSRIRNAKPYIKALLARNWQQVKNSDGVFAVGMLEPNMKAVQGGTGYAVEMAIRSKKPVFVFDQVKKRWHKWDGSKFVETSTPTLTKRFAGVGTRKINDAGRQAIRDAYEKTFSALDSGREFTAGALDASTPRAKAYVESVREAGGDIDPDTLRRLNVEEIGVMEGHDTFLDRDKAPGLSHEMQDLKAKDAALQRIKDSLLTDLAKTVLKPFKDKLDDLFKISDKSIEVRSRLSKNPAYITEVDGIPKLNDRGIKALDLEMNRYIDGLDARDLWNAWERWDKMVFDATHKDSKHKVAFRKYHVPYRPKSPEYWLSSDQISHIVEENLFGRRQQGGYPRETDLAKLIPNYLSNHLRRGSGFAEELRSFSDKIMDATKLKPTTQARFKRMLDKWQGLDSDVEMDPGAAAARWGASLIERAVGDSKLVDEINAIADGEIPLAWMAFRDAEKADKPAAFRRYLEVRSKLAEKVEQTKFIKQAFRFTGNSPIKSLADGIVGARVWSALAWRLSRYTGAQISDYSGAIGLFLADDLNDLKHLAMEAPAAAAKAAKEISTEIAGNVKSRGSRALGIADKDFEPVIREAIDRMQKGLKGEHDAVLDAIAHGMMKHHETRPSATLESFRQDNISKIRGKVKGFMGEIGEVALAPFGTGDILLASSAALLADAVFSRKYKAWNKVDPKTFVDSLGPLTRGKKGFAKELANLMEADFSGRVPEKRIREARNRFAMMLAEEFIVPSHLASRSPLYTKLYSSQKGFGRVFGGLGLLFTNHPIRRFNQLMDASKIDPSDPVRTQALEALKVSMKGVGSAVPAGLSVMVLAMALNTLFGFEQDDPYEAFKRGMGWSFAGTVSDVNPAVSYVEKALSGRDIRNPLKRRKIDSEHKDYFSPAAESLPVVGPMAGMANIARRAAVRNELLPSRLSAIGARKKKGDESRTLGERIKRDIMDKSPHRWLEPSGEKKTTRRGRRRRKRRRRRRN